MKIKCVLGLHDTTTILEGDYDLLSDLERIGKTKLIVKHCKYCKYIEIELKSLKLVTADIVKELLINEN